MEIWLQTIISVVIALIASGGFWTFLSKKADKKDLQTKMLIGLGHDRIMYLGRQYLKQKYITPDQFENLYEYLYKPYEMMGGNGSAKQIMEKVKQLPMREHGDRDEEV